MRGEDEIYAQWATIVCVVLVANVWVVCAVISWAVTR